MVAVCDWVKVPDLATVKADMMAASTFGAAK